MNSTRKSKGGATYGSNQKQHSNVSSASSNRRNAFFADVNDENLDGNITTNACTIGIVRSTVALSTIA